MLNTVLFDMGGTLEDIWYNEETLRNVMLSLWETLRRHGLDPGDNVTDMQERVLAGVRNYKEWCNHTMREKKPEEIWPDYYLKSFGFDREVLLPIAEELANLWEMTYFHRELRPDAREVLEQLRRRGYHLGVVSNNASLYNVFQVLCEGGIRDYMEDVTVSSITGYRKPHPEIFRISMRQMQARPEECVYVGDTLSADVVGAKASGIARAVLISSYLSGRKDCGERGFPWEPDFQMNQLSELIPWLDSVNPRMKP